MYSRYYSYTVVHNHIFGVGTFLAAPCSAHLFCGPDFEPEIELYRFRRSCAIKTAKTTENNFRCSVLYVYCVLYSVLPCREQHTP